ncbi:hypothetical protein [Erythrobacter sp. NAP1]|uniref:hypothetical protein n=1 Tax=Erythrobacter sp. NAP1 TaxID=237727 RepID=UPI000326402D|nr:hypothetical protein [Erythrobacter sp. NAP1]
MSMFSLLGAGLALVGSPLSSLSPFVDPDKTNPEAQAAACRDGNTSAFGRYLGDWVFDDSMITEDGTWQEGPGGEWDFHCLGNGIAVTDFFRSRTGVFGMTVRMVDPETGKWDIIYTGEGSQAMNQLTGELQEDGTIVMHYKTPAFDPMRRITFTPIIDDSFTWMLAISRDEGETWQDVYRMDARRRAP